MKTCDTCNAEKTSIPYIVHEATVTRLERINTRLWIVVLILIFALIASNLAWIIYENQFEVIEREEHIMMDYYNPYMARYKSLQATEMFRGQITWGQRIPPHGERERRCESIRRYGRVKGRGCRTQQKSV